VAGKVRIADGRVCGGAQAGRRFASGEFPDTPSLQWYTFVNLRLRSSTLRFSTTKPGIVYARCECGCADLESLHG